VNAKHVVMAFFIVVLWGLNFVALKIAVLSLPPIFLAGLRFLLISIPWIFFVEKPKVSKRQFITLPITLGVLQYSLLYYGMSTGLSAGLSAVILQTQSFFTVIMSTILIKEKPRLNEILGLLIGALGVMILLINNNGDFKIEAVLIILAAAISWGIANIQLKNLGNVNMVSFLIWISPFAAIVLFIISFILEYDLVLNIDFSNVEIKVFLSIFYTAYLSTVIGFTMWQYLLNKYKSVQITPYGLLVPVTGSIFGYIILSEVLEIYQIIAGIVIIIGLMVISLRGIFVK
jgi:O-acetylserine/cysteine efflux transporter|tara:strand:+ start:2722 stop:3585 length:864 start_codon:yes stop_codon:yes gene_type:complete